GGSGPYTMFFRAYNCFAEREANQRIDYTLHTNASFPVVQQQTIPAIVVCTSGAGHFLYGAVLLFIKPYHFRFCSTRKFTYLPPVSASSTTPSKVFPVLVEYIPLIFTFPSFKRAAAIAFVKAFLRCSKKRSFFHITKLQALSEQ